MINNRGKRTLKLYLKKLLPLIILLIITITGFALDIADATISGADVTIGWSIIIIEFVVIFGGIVIYWVVANKRLIHYVSQFKAKNYEYIIDRKRIISWFSRASQHRSVLCFIIAVSYMELGNQAEFLRYINMVDRSYVLSGKYYWLAVYSATVGDWQGYYAWKNKLLECEDDEAKKRYVQVLELVDRKNSGDDSFSEEETELIQTSSNTVKKLLLRE